MKVAVFKGIKNIILEDRPDLRPGPGEVIVKVKYCGICGTDIHSYLEPGRRATNMVLGHEVVGSIAESGDGVEGWDIGERVVVGPPGSCNECYYCLHGQPNLCMYALSRTIGISKGVDGGMAEYVRVKYPRGMLVKIPDDVSFEDAILIDTIAVAYRGIHQSSMKMGDNVVISGAGSIGLSAIQFAKINGAGHITVLDISPQKEKHAMTYGADLYLNPGEESEVLQEKIHAIYNNVGADVVVECAGSAKSFQTLMTLVRRKGQLVAIGVTGDPLSITEQQIVRSEINIQGSFVYDTDDIRSCLGFMGSKRFKTDGMVSDIIRLDDVVEKGFERLSMPNDLIKVIIEP